MPIALPGGLAPVLGVFLANVETALNMIVSGEPVPAKELADTALLDLVVDGDPLPKAVEVEIFGAPAGIARIRG